MTTRHLSWHRTAIIFCAAIILAESGASAEEFPFADLSGKTIELYLTSSQYAGVIVESVDVTKTGNELRSLKGRLPGSKQTRTFKAGSIKEIVLDNAPLDVEFNQKTGTLAFDADERSARLEHEKAVRVRLKQMNRKLWKPLGKQQHDAWLKRHNDFIASVQKQMPDVKFRLLETEFFLVLTDIPQREIAVYADYLDQMYAKVCRHFGIPDGKNIWCGKCVIVAVQNRADYIRLETKVLGVPFERAQGQGKCHPKSAGSVVITCWKGKNPEYFASVLVHETTHGVVARFLSNAIVSSWLNEGYSDWVSAEIVKADTSVKRKQLKDAKAVGASGSLGGFFQKERVKGQHGLASSMVEILMSRGSEKFRDFFRLVKEGVAEKDALQQTYGYSYDKLTELYARKYKLKLAS